MRIAHRRNHPAVLLLPLSPVGRDLSGSLVLGLPQARGLGCTMKEDAEKNLLSEERQIKAAMSQSPAHPCEPSPQSPEPPAPPRAASGSRADPPSPPSEWIVSQNATRRLEGTEGRNSVSFLTFHCKIPQVGPGGDRRRSRAHLADSNCELRGGRGRLLRVWAPKVFPRVPTFLDGNPHSSAGPCNSSISASSRASV